MLALEIEYLTGSAVAADAEKSKFDWPPQPDRVFSALVAAWGARGERAGERLALEWLEKQPPPQILADLEFAARTNPTVYVPANDSRGVNVLPARRERHERSFQVGRPTNPVVHFVWPQSPDAEVARALDAMARDTAYVGHSTSLTRCRFVDDKFDLQESIMPARRIYEGRLAELERFFKAGFRPGPGEVVPKLPALPVFCQSVFTQDWLVLRDAGGRAPDIRLAPVAAKKLRDALMGAYQQVQGSTPPSWLTGHGADGTPLREPHAAFVPLAYLGWNDYSDGRMMGLAIVMPRAIDRSGLFDALTLLIGRSGDGTCVDLHYGENLLWKLEPAGAESVPASLAPSRYTARSQLWRSATPIVLDRYPKKRVVEERVSEISDQIAQACVNIGLPKPSFVNASFFSAVQGAPSAATPRNAREWQRWQLPASLHGRYLIHAIIGFAEPVEGPLILGAGRYVGLGLCMDASKSAAQ